jgi:membrane protein
MNRKRIWESIKYYALGVYKYSEEDHCFLLAAGIAFNVLYCMLPLSLVIFYFFSAALTSSRAIEYVVSYATESFPIPINAGNVHNWLTSELTRMGHRHALAGIIGGITLFWLASALFSTLRTSVNAVFNMVSKQNMIIEKLFDFLLMVIVLALLLVSTFLSPIVNLLQRFGTDLLPAWLAGMVNTTMPRFVTLGISIALYGILFRMLPNERLSRKVIVVSASTSVVLTEAMRFAFVYYMTHISSIRSLYGTYAFLVGISLWLYYASVAFLIGAEVGWLYKERHEVVAVPELSPKEIAQIKHPGKKALHAGALDDYEKSKTNPTKPAGEAKPPTEIKSKK